MHSLQHLSDSVAYLTRRLIGFTSLVLILLIHQAQAQDSLTFDNKTTLSLGSVLSTTGSKAPFWFLINNSQRYSESANSAFANLSSNHRLLKWTKGGISYGVEYQYNLAQQSAGQLVQGYIQADLGKVRFFGGRKEEILGVRDTLLSQSTLVNGNNSLPIPKIAAYSTDWIDIPLTRGWLEFNFYISHGWLESDRLVQSPLLHQKYVYLTLGRERWKVAPYFGVQHNTLWSGFLTFPEQQLASGLKNYFRVFSGLSSLTNENQGEVNNGLGDHFGVLDFGFSIDLNSWKLLNYLHVPFEDGSGLDLKAFNSGVIGLSLRNQKQGVLRGVSLEYLNTQEQDGRKTLDGQPFYEPENYFNNFLYRNGWSYHNRSVGNGLFTIPDPTNNTWRRIENTIESLQLGAWLLLGKQNVKVKYHYFENQGNIYNVNDLINPVVNPDRLSAILVTTNFEKKGLLFETTATYQWGDSVGEQGFGLLLKISRQLF